MPLERPEKTRGPEPGLVKQAVVPKDPNAERPEKVGAARGARAPKDADAAPAAVVKVRPPLGLPPGSVRALLTLMIVAVVIVATARGTELGEFWTETLLIALAHYFSSRRLVELPPAVIGRLQAEGYLDEESHPLYLPRHSIRGLIFAAFVGLGFYLHQQGRLVALGSGYWGLPEIHVSPPILVVFVYFLGVLAKPLGGWWRRLRARPPAAWWGDMKGLVVLLVLGISTLTHVTGQTALLPEAWDHLALGLVLFYFGSR